jgi:bacterioferritin-associated ferredoxin
MTSLLFAIAVFALIFIACGLVRLRVGCGSNCGACVNACHSTESRDEPS